MTLFFFKNMNTNIKMFLRHIYSALRGNGGGDRLSNVALFNLSPLCLKKGIFINSLSLSWNVSGNALLGNWHFFFLQKYEYVPISRCFWNTYIQHWGGMGVVTDWVIDRRSIPRHPLVHSPHIHVTTTPRLSSSLFQTQVLSYFEFVNIHAYCEYFQKVLYWTAIYFKLVKDLFTMLCLSSWASTLWSR